MFFRFKLVHQFALMAFVALLVTVGLVGVALQDRTAVNVIFDEQHELLLIKNRLTHLESETLRARLDEVQVVDVKNRALSEQFERRIVAIDSLAHDLKSRQAMGHNTESLILFCETLETYRRSVVSTLVLQDKMGLGSANGLLDDLRLTEQKIRDMINAPSQGFLLALFSEILVTEKDFANTLNMRLADGLLAKTDSLYFMAAQTLPEESAKTFLAHLSYFRSLVSDLLKLTLERELKIAENALHFRNVTPYLDQAHNQVDDLLRANAEHLSAQRQTSIFWIAGIFGLALIFSVGVLIYQIRNARDLVARLQQLALGMREVASGKFADADNLPKGQDEIGMLSDTFKKMAGQLQTQIATIDQERENAESANRLKSQFLANMSHEIRTPMNSCLGILQLLEETPLAEDQKKYLQVMRQSSQSLLVLIDDILDFSKIEANRITLQKELFALNDCIQATLTMLKPQAEEKGLTLHCDIEENVPKLLLGDAGRLRQIITNLVGNAVKFTHKGDVVLRILCREKQEEQATLEFQVQDTGIGIAPEDIDRLFQPFMQVDATSTRSYGGTGLGLSICSRLVALMNGRIWVESTLGEGSTFYFTIETQFFKRAQIEREPEVTAPVSERGSLEDLAKRLPLDILLVEDNTENRLVARQMFKKMGYEVDEAVNGLEAVEMAQANAYDLIFMDLQMPFKNGIEACEEILRSKSDVKPQIVAVTANVTEEDRARTREAGMIGFVAKPFSLLDLRLAVEKCGKSGQAALDDE